MNPLVFETAIQMALASSAFSSIPVYAGTSYAELTPESLNLIVGVESIQHAAGNLYKAEVSFKITSPALSGSESYQIMAGVLVTLQASLTNQYFNANWPTAWPTSNPLTSSIPTFGGIWVKDTKQAQEDREWVSVISADIGLAV